MKTGFIGIGNMGGAILDSYAESPRGASDEILICDLNQEACRKKAQGRDDIRIVQGIGELVREADVIVIGVKPQGMESVLEEVADEYEGHKILISMAAGVSIDFIAGHFESETRIVRIMPNTPARVGEGMIALCRGESMTDDDMEKVRQVLGPAGVIQTVEEDQIDCVIGVSGSSPAYTYMYIEALMDSAVKNGMDEDQARVFAAQSVLGAAKMVLESPESVEQLRINVCSPGGTTIEAVKKLQENGFMEKVAEGFQAAVDRSMEMTREKSEGK